MPKFHATSPLDRIKRTLAMLRHIPPRQLLRRLVLMARYRLGHLLPDVAARHAAPPLAATLPLPIMPPRLLLEQAGIDRFTFRQPWGTRTLSRPIDWRLPGDEAITASWRANLHYMELLEGIESKLFAELVESWIAGNPRRVSDAWRCAWRPYNLSIRVVVWMQQIALRRQSLSAALVARAAASLAEQLRFLERHLETDIRGNHLMRNIKALLWAGSFFTGAEAHRWRRGAERLLSRELDRQIPPDGFHHELSPSYHCQVMGDLLECLSILEDGPLRRKLEAKLAAMARALTHLTHPDGLVALLNDGGLGMAYRPDELLAAYARLTAESVAFEDGPFSLPDAGFFGARWGGDYLVVDCGPIGPDELIGHGHGDILTFEWSLAGRRIIVDQGTFQHDDHPRRRVSRATASHNTLTIDDAEQCDFFGAHRCGRRAYPQLRRLETTKSSLALEGTHDGFRHLCGQPRHVRQIEARHGEIRIRDQIEGGGLHRATARYLLHPDCRLLSSEGNSLIIARDELEIEITSSTAIGIEPAEWFHDLYVAQPTSRIVIESDGPTRLIETRLRRLGHQAQG